MPDSTSSTVTLTDNGIDVTASLVREEGVDKNNNLVVNYTYQLNSISAAHNLVASIGGAVTQLYVKESGTWYAYAKAYKKINGSWVEQDITTVFSAGINYVKGD